MATGSTSWCSAVSRSFHTSCERYDAFITVRDDLEQDLAALDTDRFNAFFSNCPAFGPWRLRFLHVGAFDLDGDGFDELHANVRVYEDLGGSGALTLMDELPQEVFVDRDSDAGAYISSATTTIAAGDVTGDGRENLAVYTQWQPDLHIWGLSAIESVGFAELSTVEVSSRFNTQGRPEPIVLPINVDTDSPALKYSDGEYQLVFTEPLVVAALAAAPCAEGIGQNLGECFTTFGQGETNTVDASLTVTVKAGIHTGLEVQGSPLTAGIGGSLRKSITATASASAGAAYTVEKSRTFTTGSLEDGVVFTTIPYDRYTYSVLSHPDPDLVGTTVIVSLPREPIILKVDREFYNANVIESSIQIDDRIFDHTVWRHQQLPGHGSEELAAWTVRGSREWDRSPLARVAVAAASRSPCPPRSVSAAALVSSTRRRSRSRGAAAWPATPSATAPRRVSRSPAAVRRPTRSRSATSMATTSPNTSTATASSPTCRSWAGRSSR